MIYYKTTAEIEMMRQSALLVSKTLTAIASELKPGISTLWLDTTIGTFIRDPGGTVVVTSFVGTQSEQIRVVGEASKPQTLPYRQNMTLLDVMIAVGGLTDFADGNGAKLLRSAEGNTQYSVRLADLIRRGDISANVDMRPGDVLIIPQSWF